MSLELHTALANAQALKGSILVVKAGGELLENPSWLAAITTDVVALHRLGVRIVLVHGGGPQLDRTAERAGLKTERVAGRRITSPDLLAAAIQTWRGELSARWVSALAQQGEVGVGLAGFDGGMLRAHRRPPVEVVTDEGHSLQVDYGEVGDVHRVEVGLLLAVIEHAIPVISPLAAGPDGTILNVNADTIAAKLAAALGATSLVLLTRSPGILSNLDDPTSVLARVNLATCEELASTGALQGGMRPKFAAIRSALEAGVKKAHVVDGRVAGVLLDELLTNEGHGTLVVP